MRRMIRHWTSHIVHKMWVDYLNPEGPDGDMPDIGSFAPTEVATYGDETEDVDILETPEATIENVPLPVAPIEMPAPKVPSV